jgi:hypothetical protein
MGNRNRSGASEFENIPDDSGAKTEEKVKGLNDIKIHSSLRPPNHFGNLTGGQEPSNQKLFKIVTETTSQKDLKLN